MIPLKIVSWNCNCKFREKFKEIIKLDADIYIIQECEDPKTCSDKDYQKFAKNSIWVGQNKNKGLGIFAKDGIKLKKNNWDTYCLRNFISVKVNDDFDLLGVWAGDPYISEYYVYQNININNYSSNTIIIGDFNSNKIWDKKGSIRTHMNVVNELEKKGLISAYHHITGENQGEESEKTFFLYRNPQKGYHIDHCFLNKKYLKQYQILSNDSWLSFSDHIPIKLEIECSETNKINYDSIINNCISYANTFYETINDIESKTSLELNEYISVFATNLAFSCELYLKAMLIKENHCIKRGHDLSKLYADLSDETKLALKAEFDREKGLNELQTVLNKCSKTFEDFRYLYENNEIKNLYRTDLGNLVRSLRSVCKDKFDLNIK